MKITLTGLDTALSSMQKRQSLLKQMTKETLRDIGEWYIDFLQNDVWETEGAVFGENWTPLNPDYALQKSKKYPGRGVLEASGKLRNSWRLYTTSQYALIENTAQSEDGTYYAIYHQQGTNRLPKRVIAKIDEQRKNKIYQMFSEGITRRFESAR